MAIATAIAIYFLIWWIVLFAVLPWGVRAQGEDGRRRAPIPARRRVPRLRAKLLWTTGRLPWSVGDLCGGLRQGLGHARRARRAARLSGAKPLTAEAKK